MADSLQGKKGQRTLKSQSHLCLQVLEVIRHCCLRFGAHLLAGPLEGAVEFLGDIHLGGCLLATILDQHKRWSGEQFDNTLCPTRERVVAGFDVCGGLRNSRGWVGRGGWEQPCVLWLK